MNRDKQKIRTESLLSNMLDNSYARWPQRPLFPIDLPNESLSVTTTLRHALSGKNVLLWVSRALRILHLNWKAISATLAVTLFATLWYYPTFFLFLLFTFYSLLLITVGEYCCRKHYIRFLKYRLHI